MKNSQPIKTLDDYDLSIIMPLYKRLDEFKRVFPKKAHYYQRNGIEVVIVLDAPDEKDNLISYLKKYPLINWKIVMNANDHEWRNPAKPFNVGIRQATKGYILIMDPELEFHTDVIHILREKLHSYRDSFAVGQVIFTDSNQVISDKTIPYLNAIPYGSIMARKELFERVGGFDEYYKKWGGEDDNIRARMELAGFKKLFFPDALLVHREDHQKSNIIRNKQRAEIEFKDLKRMLLPHQVVMNEPDEWGRDFDEIVYGWKTRCFQKETLEDYLKEFEDYEFGDLSILKKEHQIIVLVPCFNEEDLLVRFIEKIEPHCDGIIFLDDGSTDQSYELMQCSKLLLKVKKRREEFNDLENRNILLKLSAFFKSEWYCFMDVDECFDFRFETIRDIANKDHIDTVGFWVVNLWDDTKHFRTDMTDSHNLSESGFIFRWRMFRDNGFMQLNVDRKLHFPTIPYFNKGYVSSVLIKHYGCLSKRQRQEKHRFYKIEDTVGYDDYTYLQQEEVALKELASIKIDVTIQSSIKK